MNPRNGEADGESPLRRDVELLSGGAIFARALLAGIGMLGFTTSMQWFIYFRWMHEPGTLEIAGSVMAGALMFALVFRSLHGTRQRQMELIGRLRTIRWMNDRIRNSLQTIECVTYAAAPHATDEVRLAVDSIESILGDYLADGHAPQRTEHAEETPHGLAGTRTER
jgi:hypothetical protein